MGWRSYGQRLVALQFARDDLYRHMRLMSSGLHEIGYHGLTNYMQ